jgi:hypothetical protein
MATMSAAYERFHTSFFDDDSNSARDGLDFESLRALEGAERQRAEDELLARLPDIRAIMGLGELRAVAAAPELRKVFDRERPQASYKLIASAVALWRIAPDPAYVDAVAGAVAHASSPERRMEAVLATRELRDAGAVPALVGALDDEDELVRSHAVDALYDLHGVALAPGDLQHPSVRVMSDDDAVHGAAKDDVLRAIAGRTVA